MIALLSTAQSWLRRRNGVLIGVLLLLTPVVIGLISVGSPFSFTERVNKLPAALVNQDEPVQVNGKDVDAGAALSDDLVADAQFTWSQVSMAQAQEGLQSGKYAVTLVIPPDYSANIASLDSPSPQAARIRVMTNDAVNVLTPTLIQGTISNIEDRIDADIQISFLDAVYAAIDLITQQGQDELTRVEKLAKQASTASTSASDADSQVTLVSGTTADVSSTANTVYSSATATLAKTDTTATYAADTVDNAAGVVAGATTIDSNLQVLEEDLLADGKVSWANRVANIRTKMDNLVISRAENTVDSANTTLSAADEAETSASSTAASASGLSSQAATVSAQASKASRLTAETARLLNDKIVPGVDKISAGLQDINNKMPAVVTSSRDDFQKVLLAPVITSIDRSNAVFPIGEGLTAQAIPMALFLGAILTFLLIPALSTRLRLGWARADRVLAAPLFAAAALAAAQTVLMVIAMVLLGVRATAWPTFLLFVLLTALMLVAILQLLRAGLGVAGVFAGVVLMSLMLASNAGVLPRQVLTAPFAALEPINPLSYASDAIRRSVAGGPLTPYLFVDGAVLVITTLLAVAGSYAIARWRRGVQISDLVPQVGLV